MTSSASFELESRRSGLVSLAPDAPARQRYFRPIWLWEVYRGWRRHASTFTGTVPDPLFCCPVAGPSAGLAEMMDLGVDRVSGPQMLMFKYEHRE
jgi:hypothetical protein